MAAQRYVTQYDVQDDRERHEDGADEEDALQTVEQSGSDVRQQHLQKVPTAFRAAESGVQLRAHLGQQQRIGKQFQTPPAKYRAGMPAVRSR